MDEEIFEAWDALHVAIQRVLVSQPSEMTEAAENLDVQRKNFDRVVRRKAMHQS